jgi:hypothetical protein
MSGRYPSLHDHFANSGRKRILCLDGGGIRGILSLGFLLEVETLLRRRHGGDPAFRLCHYFDLIAGTSTGSIIAALLAQGWSTSDIIALYKELADKIFCKRWWDPRSGLLRPRYDRNVLARFLQEKIGETVCLGDQEKLLTGLLVVCKRIDSGIPWPMSNNPNGRYFQAQPGSTTIPNKDYKLWQVVRASTAAPTFFKPEKIQIAAPTEGEPQGVSGDFMDGGVSPHNNPSLQAYWLATLEGYGLRWPTGPDNMLIVSVGTGRLPESRNAGRLSVLQGITALQSLMDDCGAVVESMMQGMGRCLHTPRIMDPELRTLSPHELSNNPRYSYVRYDVKLYRDPKQNPQKAPRDGIIDNPILQEANLSDDELLEMQKMDNPKPKGMLLKLGYLAAARKVHEEHFPREFDLISENATCLEKQPKPASNKQRYLQRPGNTVHAIQMTLGIESLTYRRWGDLQSAKEGDWLVERDGQAHTVDADSFAHTYRKVGPALYEKHSTVWAAPAIEDGIIQTREGKTHYSAGDFIVWNNDDGTDGYAMKKEKFESLYRRDTSDDTVSEFGENSS